MQKQNQKLTPILVKVEKDAGCDSETALSWALCAKNALIKNNGFGPGQLVYGLIQKQEAFCKETVLKSFANLTGKHMSWSF